VTASEDIENPDRREAALRLESIFMPHMRSRREALYYPFGKRQTQARFAHYTSAEAALSIIRSKRVWMRNSTCMSDYKEVQHGFEILKGFFLDDQKRAEFFAALDEISPKAAEEAISIFDQWWTTTQFSTYISSISEHDASEDAHGRLSMWRAFGSGTARVAIVLAVPWESGGAEALNVTLNPVSYLSEPAFHQILASVAGNIRRNADFLRGVERPALIGTIFNMLLAGVTCLKHEGFHEEREWRAIYSPQRLPSDLMKAQVQVINGIPQTVYLLPIDGEVCETMSELDFVSMFDRLIVGPTQFPLAIHEAFTRELDQAGVSDAATRIVISQIPIRT
jgi:hypothetical protein